MSSIGAVLYGVTAPTSADGYQTANGAGEQGFATSWGKFYAIVVTDQSVASANRNVDSVNDVTGTTYGHQLRTTGTNTGIQGQIRQSGGAGLTSGPAYTIAAGSVGKVILVHNQINIADGLLEQYIGGALNGTPTAISAYGVPDTAVPHAILRLAAASAPLLGAYVLFGGAWHGKATAAEILAHYAACKAAGRAVALSGGAVTATVGWTVPAGSAAPATISDSVGSSTLTKQGSPGFMAFANPPWV